MNLVLQFECILLEYVIVEIYFFPHITCSFEINSSVLQVCTDNILFFSMWAVCLVSMVKPAFGCER